MKKILNKKSESKIKDDCDFGNCFESNPIKLQFLKNLTIKIGSACKKNNCICLFKSIDDILVLCFLD